MFVAHSCLTVHSGAGVGRSLVKLPRLEISYSRSPVARTPTRHGRFLGRLRGTVPGVAERRDRRVPDVRQLSAQGRHRAATGRGCGTARVQFCTRGPLQSGLYSQVPRRLASQFALHTEELDQR